MYSRGIKISGSIFLSLQQNLCKPPFTVIMTDIQKLNFSVSVAQSVFELIALTVNHRFYLSPTRYYVTNDYFLM
jgi:hypothetical protein